MPRKKKQQKGPEFKATIPKGAVDALSVEVRRLVRDWGIAVVSVTEIGIPYPGSEHAEKPPIVKIPQFGTMLAALYQSKVKCAFRVFTEKIAQTADVEDHVEGAWRRYIAWNALFEDSEFCELLDFLVGMGVFSARPTCAHPDEIFDEKGRLRT